MGAHPVAADTVCGMLASPLETWDDLTAVGAWLGRDSHDPDRGDWENLGRDHGAQLAMFAALVVSCWGAGEREVALAAALAYATEAVRPFELTAANVGTCLSLELGYSLRRWGTARDVAHLADLVETAASRLAR